MILKCHDFDTNEKLALTKNGRHMQPAVLEQPRRYTGSYSASGSPFQLHNISKLVYIMQATMDAIIVYVFYLQARHTSTEAQSSYSYTGLGSR